jgi:hypothetical protein
VPRRRISRSDRGGSGGRPRFQASLQAAPSLQARKAVRNRLRQELRLVQAAYGRASAGPGESWVRVDDRDLIPGWNRRSTPVLIEIPIGYPTIPPDNFLTPADLRLADGRVPSNTMGIKTIDGSEWLAFSHHAEAGTWRAHVDLTQSHTLVDYVAGVLDRLRECS